MPQGELVPRFALTGERLYQSRSFQGMLFEGIDYRSLAAGPSFFRCDFRGASFKDCHLRDAQFLRCDFVSTAVRSTGFECCDFSTAGIDNSVFVDSRFERCKFEKAGVDGTRFENCDFSNISFVQTGIRNSQFSGCRFRNCTFERATNVALRFDDCQFDTLDFSNLYAIDLFFSGCRADRYIVCPDYIGSYHFDSFPKHNLTFNYRDARQELVPATGELLATLFEHFVATERSYEALNAAIAARSLGWTGHDGSLGAMAVQLLETALSAPPHVRAYNLPRLLTAAGFYLGTGTLTAIDCVEIVRTVEAAITSGSLSFEERERAIGFAGNTMVRLREGAFPWSALRPDRRAAANLELTYEDGTEKEVLEAVEALLSAAAAEAGVEDFQYRVAEVRRGSVVVEIVASVGLALAMVKFLNSTVREFASTAVALRVAQRKLELLEGADVSQLEAIQRVRLVESSAPKATKLLPSSVTLEL